MIDNATTCSNCEYEFQEGDDRYPSRRGDPLCEECHEAELDGLEEMARCEGDDWLIDGVGFSDPGGRSALRAETPDNPRDQDCPDCGAECVLTRIDAQRGYCCDRCADRKERGLDY